MTAFPSPIPLWFSFPGNKLLSLSPAGIREDMNLFSATCFTNIIISSLEHLGLHSLSLARASWGQLVCFYLVPLVPQPDLYRYLRIVFLLSVISLRFCLQFSYILTYNCPYSCPKMSYSPFSKDGVWICSLFFLGGYGLWEKKGLKNVFTTKLKAILRCISGKQYTNMLRNQNKKLPKPYKPRLQFHHSIYTGHILVASNFYVAKRQWTFFSL